MTYTWAGEGMLIIDATDVNENYRGQGVGRQLLDALVAFVREKDVKSNSALPICKIGFDKDPSIGDVLKK